MKNEVKIVVGVGLAAGLTGGVYAFSKQELKVERRCLNNSEGMSSERRLENMFKGHDNDKAREEMEKMAKSIVDDNCIDDTYTVRASDISVGKLAWEKPSLTLNEKEKISDIIKGMSEQELRIVLQNIPVGLMFDEIGDRLSMYEQFATSIQDAFNCLPR